MPVQCVPGFPRPGLSLNPLRLHTGGNGGYQALNLAVLFGASPVMLLGFDMHNRSGEYHWHGRHGNGLANPGNDTIQTWIEAFRTTPPDLQRAGTTVINCTPDSALDCYPMMDIKTACEMLKG